MKTGCFFLKLSKTINTFFFSSLTYTKISLSLIEMKVILMEKKIISSWVTLQTNCTFILLKLTKPLFLHASQCVTSQHHPSPAEGDSASALDSTSPWELHMPHLVRSQRHCSASHLFQDWIRSSFIFLKEIIMCIYPGTGTMQSSSQGTAFILGKTSPDKARGGSRQLHADPPKVPFAALSCEKKFSSSSLKKYGKVERGQL